MSVTYIGVRMDSEAKDKEVSRLMIESWIEAAGAIAFKFRESYRGADVEDKGAEVVFNTFESFTAAFKPFMDQVVIRLNKEMHVVDAWCDKDVNYYVVLKNVTDKNIIYYKKKMLRAGDSDMLTLPELIMCFSGLSSYIKDDSFDVNICTMAGEDMRNNIELTKIVMDSLAKKY